VLEFDDYDVDYEGDDEIVVFLRVGDMFDENDCGNIGELIVIVVGEVEIDEGVDTGVFRGGGSGISKISTVSKSPLEPFCPPPKKILFVEDVDASQTRG
jgi:hypothetical protein